MVLLGAAIVPAAKLSTLIEVGLDQRPTGSVTARETINGVVDTLTTWDGRWYFELVRSWYPHSVSPHITYDDPGASAAFFPVYPALVRAANVGLPGGDVTAGIAVNFALGSLFIYTVGVLARRWFDADTAKRAMMLACLYPGSFVLSITYSEATLLVAAAACFLALEHQRWMLAGLAGLVAGASRPNGAAVVLACAVVAFHEVRRRDDKRRNWQALISVAVAPIGTMGALWYIGHQAHEPLVWFRVQREAWGEGTSFGVTAVRHIGRFAVSPFSSPTNVVTTMSVLSLVIGLMALWRVRAGVPKYAVVYCIGVVLLMVAPSTVTARPRFVYTAFPLIIAVAAAWPARWRGEVWQLACSLCGATLVAVVALYGLYAVVIP